MYEGFWDPDYIESYVLKCMNQCDWSNVRFSTKSKHQKEIALGKLLSSPKWQRPLKEREKEFLMEQIN